MYFKFILIINIIFNKIMGFFSKKISKEEEEKLIGIAVKFLKNPKVINQTFEAKKRFLKEKVKF